MAINRKNWHHWGIDEKHYSSEIVTEFMQEQAGVNNITEGSHRCSHQAAAYFPLPYAPEKDVLAIFSWFDMSSIVEIKCEDMQLLSSLSEEYKQWIENGEDGGAILHPYHADLFQTSPNTVSVLLYKEFEDETL